MTPRWARKAMDKAISRVRFESASIRLPGTPFGKDDTEAIREATRLYTETWIVPLLKAVRDGNRAAAERMTGP